MLRQITIRVPAELAERVGRLQRLAGYETAHPSRSALIAALLAEALTAAEERHHLPPLDASPAPQGEG